MDASTASTIAIISLMASALSAVGAILSAAASSRSARAAEASLQMSREHNEKSSELTKSIFKRQGVISLHETWQDMRGIDPNNLIVPDVVRAINTLGLTSALWNHEVVDRDILFQQYWTSFRSLYDTLDSIAKIIPNLNKTGKDLLSPSIRLAYGEMYAMETSLVKTSHIS